MCAGCHSKLLKQADRQVATPSKKHTVKRRGPKTLFSQEEGSQLWVWMPFSVYWMGPRQAALSCQAQKRLEWMLCSCWIVLYSHGWSKALREQIHWLVAGHGTILNTTRCKLLEAAFLNCVQELEAITCGGGTRISKICSCISLVAVP
jgi:hypothetical protein